MPGKAAAPQCAVTLDIWGVVESRGVQLQLAAQGKRGFCFPVPGMEHYTQQASTVPLAEPHPHPPRREL